MTKDQILAELQRVANLLGTPSVSQTGFLRHSRISVGCVCHAFGSWNRAVQEAGLTANPSSKGGGKSRSPYADEDLLYEIVRLTKELGKEPTEADMNGYGIATSTPYAQRWGSFARAREEAYRVFGTPLLAGINHRSAWPEAAIPAPGLPDVSREIECNAGSAPA